MFVKIGCGGYINDQLFTMEIPVNLDIIYYKKLNKLLKISPVKNKLCRLGKHGDGGYVMIEAFQHGGVAYSFGINDDVSWDDDIVKRGYDVYMYDHSINTLPYECDGFHFYKRGIGSKKIASFDTLEHILEENGHMSENDMILKMDVEGAEWEILASMKETILSKFSQIVIEYHDILGADTEKTQVIFSALEKINNTHRLIHLHGNNMGTYMCGDNRLFPNALEATYVRKGMPSIVWGNKEIDLPVPLDEPNDPYRPDLILGRWNSYWK